MPLQTTLSCHYRICQCKESIFYLRRFTFTPSFDIFPFRTLNNTVGSILSTLLLLFAISFNESVGCIIGSFVVTYLFEINIKRERFLSWKYLHAKFLTIFSIYFQTGVPRHFHTIGIAVVTQHPTVSMSVSIKDATIRERKWQKDAY